MSKCLRCGADSSWIQGRVPDEPKSDAYAELVRLAKAVVEKRDRWRELPGRDGVASAGIRECLKRDWINAVDDLRTFLATHDEVK